MKKLFPLLTLLFTLNAHAEMGFYHPGTFPEATPAAISKAVPSVFKIWVPGGGVKLRLNNWTQEEWRQAFDAAEKKKDYLTSSQLEYCHREQLRPCLVFADVASGTAFLMGKGDQLWTNRHLFLEMLVPWIEAWKENNPEATQKQIAQFAFNFPVALILYDYNDKKLNGLSLQKNFKYLKFGPMANRLADPQFFETFSTDIAVVQLPISIGEPLKLAKRPAQIGETLYTLGYPVMTTNRKELFGKPDSSGQRQQHMSFGAKIDLDESLTRLGKMNSQVRDAHAMLSGNPLMKKMWQDTIQFIEGDCESGNSGGPVLNADGEVVAIFSARMSEYRGTTPSLMFGLAIDLTSTTTNPDFNF